MKIHFKINMSNKNHTQFTIFEDGVKCGQVCMTTIGFVDFHIMISKGCNSLLDTFESSGKCYKGEINEN